MQGKVEIHYVVCAWIERGFRGVSVAILWTGGISSWKLSGGIFRRGDFLVGDDSKGLSCQNFLLGKR